MTHNFSDLVIIGHSNAVTSLAFSADGNSLVSASYDHTVIVWDVATWQMRRLMETKNYINDIVLRTVTLTK